MVIQDVIKNMLSGVHSLVKKRYFYSKIRGISRFNPSNLALPYSINREHKELWKPFSQSVNLRWLRAYIARSGIKSHLYVPEDIYYCEIEPRINNKALTIIYTDKNHYDRIFSGLRLPLTILRGMGGLLYDREYSFLTLEGAAELLRGVKSFVIKPSINSGGGRSVRKYFLKSTRFAEDDQHDPLETEDIIKMYLPDFICQDVVFNDDYFKEFNPSSLNTVRFLVYRSVINGRPEIIHTVLRIGLPGSVVDNQAAGGFACGVTAEGTLNGVAVNKKGELFSIINGKSLSQTGKMPGFELMRQLALEAGQRVQYSHLIGLDLCIDQSGKPLLIEVNCQNNEINFFQMLNGPLFGRYTEEIINWSRTQKKKIVFDFEI